MVVAAAAVDMRIIMRNTTITQTRAEADEDLSGGAVRAVVLGAVVLGVVEEEVGAEEEEDGDEVLCSTRSGISIRSLDKRVGRRVIYWSLGEKRANRFKLAHAHREE